MSTPNINGLGAEGVFPFMLEHFLRKHSDSVRTRTPNNENQEFYVFELIPNRRESRVYYNPSNKQIESCVIRLPEVAHEEVYPNDKSPPTRSHGTFVKTSKTKDYAEENINSYSKDLHATEGFSHEIRMTNEVIRPHFIAEDITLSEFKMFIRSIKQSGMMWTKKF